MVRVCVTLRAVPRLSGRFASVLSAPNVLIMGEFVTELTIDLVPERLSVVENKSW